jgi:Arc/MetJ-type ribon-helix-helix transcriptional regulator
VTRLPVFVFLLDFANDPRYVLGMTRKIAISLPDSTLEKARAAIRAGRAPNVSSYMARLIEDASATETFDEMIAAWVRESGATEEEIDAAQEESRRAFERAGLVGKRPRREKAARKAG